MVVEEQLKDIIFEIIKNQLKINDPPETKEIYDGLMSRGCSDLEARQFIGQCILVELSDLIKLKKPFDRARYIKNLKALPKEPLN